MKYLPKAVFTLACVVMLVGSVTRVAAQAPVRLGGIRGSVYDKEFSGPLSKVQVTVVEVVRMVQTSEDGMFTVEGIAPGKYTVLFGKDGYLRQAVEVMVTEGGFADVRVELAGEVTEMEEFVVRGLELGGSTELGLLGIRQEAIGMQDAISADLLSKAGASTAAGALKLVVGTSVQDDKYAVIRGLADRYLGTLVNGMTVPSPDPEKRAVQLDIFPAGTIESITVYKTFTPDLQGDFSGGGINIKTKSIPDKLTISISGGLEYNTQATGNDKFQSYRGGGTGFLGIAGDERQLPSGVSNLTVPRYNPPGPSLTPTPAQMATAQLLDQQTKAFAPAMGVQSPGGPQPNYSFQALIGNKLRLNDNNTLGVYGALTYRHKYSYSEGQSDRIKVGTDGTPSTPDPDEFTRSTEEVLWGVISGVEWRFVETHAIGLKLLFNQSAKDDVRYEVSDTSVPWGINQSLHYTERRLATAQLYGEHKFKAELAPQFDWYGALGLASQDEPDVRFFRNAYDPVAQRSFMTAAREQATTRIWRNIEEIDKQAAMNLKFPFRQWTGTEGFVKLGGFFDEINRDYDQQSFTYWWENNQIGGFGNPASRYNLTYVRFNYGPGLWTDVFTDAGRVGLATNSPPSPNQLLWYIQPTGLDMDYTGKQVIEATYLMSELPLTPWLKLIGGARIEKTDLSIRVKSMTGNVLVLENAGAGYGFVTTPDALAGTQLMRTDILPALGLVWEVVPRVFFRANWSETIARPTFRELAPVGTAEFLGDEAFVGNSELEVAEISNYDVRLEWFRRPGDLLALSAFYKTITKPIERIGVSVSGAGYILPVNYDEGEVFGVEIEARQKLDILHKALTPFTVGANGSLIKSAVKVPEVERSQLATYGLDTPTRPMQGQPEYLANAFVICDLPQTGTTLSLFYTFTGRSLIAGAGAAEGDATPNLYEEEFPTLNFSMEQKIGRRWTARFQAKNLLDPPVKLVYEVPTSSGELLHTKYHRGMDFSLSTSYSW